MYSSSTYQSPIGPLTLASDGENIVGLWMNGQKYYGYAIANNMKPNDDLPVLQDAKRWLDWYFAGQKPAISELPLRLIGSDFRQQVWRILCEIPYGEVITYGDIAKKMAAKLNREHMASQAVGGAVGHNPISVIVPCHRVVGANGSLTGYAGGVSKKVALLTHEGVDMANLSVPTKGTAL